MVNPGKSTVHVDKLAPHQCAVVTLVEAPDSDLERLMAMGVCGGRTVELIQRGDPIILKVYGTRIGISARLARRILVQPCEAPHLEEDRCPVPKIAP